MDVGAVGPTHPVPAAARPAGVVLRNEVAPRDVDVAARADLVVLQPQSRDEAELIAPALGLAEGREWQSRIPSGMLGAAAHRVPDRPPGAGPYCRRQSSSGN